MNDPRWPSCSEEARPHGGADVEAVRFSRVRPQVADALPIAPVFRPQDATVSLSTLYRLVNAGAVEKVGHGLYRRLDAPLVDLDLASVVVREPRATICLLSALAQHRLVTEIPTRWDLAVPRTRTPVVVDHATRWHRLDAETFDIARTTITLDGSDVRIGLYSPERAIVDAFRFPRLLPRELAIEALREWLPRRGSTPADLLRVAQALPGSPAGLHQALEVLL